MQYDVSVIIAVYNCEQYIEEAVRSVEAQTIGKEHIQLILVNDGSTDKSGEICDRISAANANSIVIHKEHCGVSAARNTGLEIADGRFLTFIDADDLWIGSAFLEAVAFLDRHPETDVVAFPMYWFDARSGQHDKNDKFANGTRVIDLEEEPNYSLFSVSSSFFRRSVFADIRFDTRLMFAEDMLVCQKVLSKKKTLGVFSGESKYMYRRRKNGSSAMQHTRDNPYWYIPKAQILKEELLSSQQDIPTFIQYAIMNDFEWYLNISDESKVLSPQDVSVFRNTVISVLEILSDEVILSSTLLMNIL